MDAVQQIKERLDIVEVVSQYVELHKAGKSYKGKSPFTNEKTPSFFVSPDRGMYYCFSSNQGGDVFTFIEQMEGVDFKGALKILAEKAGVELVPEDPKKRSARENQFALLDAATDFFFRTGQNTADAQTYLKERGLSGETIHAWRIGYAPDAWRALKEHLTAQSFTEAEIARAGLIKRSEKASESYDVFRDRIMFPICDASGRVVAFSGRTLHGDADTPKYVNSPETELYRKSEILFGYDKARQNIRKFDFSLIVEGQFDLVLAYQAGYTNTVAVSGTALTEHHVQLLQRFSNRTVLALDSDRAGLAAVARAAAVMLSRGMDVKVADMPEGEDPADLVATDAAAFKKVVKASRHVIEHITDRLKSSTTDERTFKLRVREEVVPLVAAIPNQIDREHFERVLADALDTTKEGIHGEVTRVTEAQKKQERRSAAPSDSSAQIQTSQPRHDMRDKVAEYARYFATLVEILRTEDAKRTVYEKLITYLDELEKEYAPARIRTEQTAADINEYIAEISRRLKRDYEDVVRSSPDKVLAEELAENFNAFVRILINVVIQEHRDTLVECEAKGKDTETIMTQISELQKKRENTRFIPENFTNNS